MTQIVKATARFPFVKNPGDVNATGPAVPGPAYLGSQVLIASSTGIWTFPDPLSAAVEGVSQKVQCPPEKNGLPLTAISIAPDSAIHSCDIQLGSSNGDSGRFRLSPGNPYIGDIGGSDFVNVTLPVSMPSLNATNGSGSFAWDAVAAPAAGGDIWSFPLRLEYWYGACPHRVKDRAPYHARFKLSTFAAAGSIGAYVVTDGRKRIAVDIIAGTATASIAVFGIWSKLTITAGGVTDVIDAASFPLVPNVAVPIGQTRKVIANGAIGDEIAPFPLIAFVVTDSAIVNLPVFHQVDVHAYD